MRLYSIYLGLRRVPIYLSIYLSVIDAAAKTALSETAARARSEQTAVGRHTVSADLGDISYGMSSAENPVITLDGLPLLGGVNEDPCQPPEYLLAPRATSTWRRQRDRQRAGSKA